MCEMVGKADLLLVASDPFDRKKFREAVDLPLTCHMSPSVTTFAVRLSEVRHLLFDLDLYGGTESLTHWEGFLFFLRELLMLFPCLSVVFQLLVHLCSFLACWRQANVTPIPKGLRPSLLQITDQFP